MNPRRYRHSGKARPSRQRAVQALRESEQRHRLLFELNPNPIYVLDERTLRILAVNRAMAKQYGWSRSELLRMTANDIRPARDIKRLREALRSQSGAVMGFGGTWQHRRKNGSLFDVEVNVSAINFGGRPARLVLVNDITERKNAEAALREINASLDQRVAERTAALRESERRLREAQHIAGIGNWEWNLRTGEVRWSPEIYAMHGLAPDAPALTPGMLIRRVHHDDRARVKTAVSGAISEGTPADIEYRAVRPDGSIRVIHAMGAVTESDAKGRPLIMVGTSQDITVRRQAEATMQADLDATRRLADLGMLFAREDNLQHALAKALDAAIAITCADFGSIQLLDHEINELKTVAQRGFPKWWVDSWSRVPKGKGICGTALEQGRRVIVEDVAQSSIFADKAALRIQLKAGVRAVQSTPLVSRSGKALGMLSTHYKTPRRPDPRTLPLLDLLARQTADLIEHVQAGAAMREGEARFRAIFDASGDGMMLSEPRSGRIRMANKACLDMLGYKSEELTALGIDDLHPKEDLPFIRAEIAKFGRGEIAQRAEIRFRRKDGSILNTELSPTAVRLNGQDYVLVSLRDITERKDAERALARSNRALRAVTACSEALLRAKSEEELFHEVCRIIVGLGGYPMAWVGLAEDDRRKTIRPVAHAGYADHIVAGPPISWTGNREAGDPAAAAIRTRKPVIMRGMAKHKAFAPWRLFLRKLRSDCALGLPLFADGRCFGALTIFASDPTNFAPGEVRLLERFADDLGYGIQVLRTREARGRLEKQLLEVSEREQRRIGQDLHDGLGQLVAGARLHCEATAHQLAREKQPAARDVVRIADTLAEALEQTRQIARGLHPVHPGADSLMAALGELSDSVTRMSHIPCLFICPHRVLVPDHAAATHLYRIAQEAANNAVRHGHPGCIRIRLDQANGGVRLGIEDDGCGLPAAAEPGNGLGLSIMQYRASVIGATIAISRRRCRGTVVRCVWKPGQNSDHTQPVTG